ncbi:MAG: sugar phosphate isomerase/epimerase family protein [bacterium]
MTKVPVALQLYTVRDESAKDFVGTLRKVSEMGYAGVEFGGTYGSLKASELKALLEELKLKVAGNHVSFDLLEKDIDSVMDFNIEIGNRYIICPAMPQDRRGSEEGFRKFARAMNSIGKACKKRGLQFCYHNHAFEFQKFGDKYALDILYESSDPDLVKAEIDTYWVQYGGGDPAKYIRRYAGRCPLVHLKDMADDPDRSFAEVGEGVLDFKSIFAASSAAGVEWYVVEQDKCKRPSLESARLSLKNLKSMGVA